MSGECWCNGTGGRGSYMMSREPVPGFPEGWVVAKEYCACPAGGERKHFERERMRLAYRRSWAQVHFDADAKVPLRYSEFTLRSSPVDSVIVGRVREFIEEGGDGCYFWGPPGTGKTGLAVGLLKALMVKYWESGRYVNAPELLATLRGGYGAEQGNRSSLLCELQEVPILIIDDIGVDKPSDWVESSMYSIIGPRHSEERTTIFTSNYSIGELATRIGERTAWRIVEMCRNEIGEDSIVRVDGVNLRDYRALKAAE